MEIYSSAFPNLLFNFVQYRDRPDFIGAVCFLPGYPVPMDCIHPVVDVYVSDFLYDRQLSSNDTKSFSSQPGVPVHPLLPKDCH